MDAVYILGGGSLANDLEIKLSVRSLQAHMVDLRDVYVIGENPEELPGVIHVPANDSSPEKWKNAYGKIKKACLIDSISDEFLLMNDDFFMTADFVGAAWPFYALKNSNGGTCGAHSFHVHCPIRFSKEMYLKMPFSTDQKACRSPRSFYANFYGAPPVFIDDVVVSVGNNMKDPDMQIAGKKSFSVGDHAMLYLPFVDWLMVKYSKPSRYEL